MYLSAVVPDASPRRPMISSGTLSTKLKRLESAKKSRFSRPDVSVFCEQGPIVKVLPDESFYVQVKPEDAKEIVAEHLVKGREVPRLLYDKSLSMSRTGLEGYRILSEAVPYCFKELRIHQPR